MKHTMIFDSEDMQDMEVFRRYCTADAMAHILYDCVNQDSACKTVTISAKSSKAIREACCDAGIRFDEIWS